MRDQQWKHYLRQGKVCATDKPLTFQKHRNDLFFSDFFCQKLQNIVSVYLLKMWTNPALYKNFKNRRNSFFPPFLSSFISCFLGQKFKAYVFVSLSHIQRKWYMGKIFLMNCTIVSAFMIYKESNRKSPKNDSSLYNLSYYNTKVPVFGIVPGESVPRMAHPGTL